MKAWILILLVALATPTCCFAKANGSWLKKVPRADRARGNPHAGSADAAAAGQNLFRNNCAKCHGEDAQGKDSRPSLRSERVRNATDGELAWLLKNGSEFKGMPRWGGPPEHERWQIITYIRTLTPQTPEGQQ